ncbi:MAG: TMEM165/GDT1 family protein [Methanothrix sp.]|nr:TMEM165/GDT1 family protein [Methanothrix sp.]
MGDKTQLSILLLSSRTQEYARLVLGVMLARGAGDDSQGPFGIGFHSLWDINTKGKG